MRELEIVWGIFNDRKDPLADGESFAGHACDLKDGDKGAGDDSGEAFVATDDGALHFLPADTPHREFEALSANRVCARGVVPCCHTYVKVKVCLPRKYVWYRIVYRCRVGKKVCLHRI